MKNMFFYDTKIGRIAITDNGKDITGVERADGVSIKDMNICETELLKEASRQLAEYLDGFRKTFDLPLNPQGTEFQKKVWNALCDIPYGEIRSYKQIAEAVRNPIMIFIPCHRVIGSNGSLVGYGGGLDMKEKLLSLEKVKTV